MADRGSTTGDRAEQTAARLADLARKRPWLRRVGVVVCFLLAGAIINVLVAWGCWYNRHRMDEAYLPDSAFRTDSIDAHEQHWLKRSGEELRRPIDSDSLSGALFSSGESDEPNSPDEDESVSVIGTFGYRLREMSLHDTELAELFDGKLINFAPEYRRPSYRRVLVGFPLRSFWGSVWYTTNDWRTATNDQREMILHHLRIRPGPDPFGLGPDDVYIPSGILVLGAITNTAVYGAIVWMLCAAPIAIRRHRRAKRNRCPDCGYDLRGADHGKCPECGEAVG